MDFWQMWKKCGALTRSPYTLEGGSGKGRVTTVNGNGETKLQIHKVAKSVSDMPLFRSGRSLILLNSIRFQRNFVFWNESFDL